LKSALWRTWRHKGAEAESNFFISHGGLAQWHTPEAQAYMESRGHAHWQMKIIGSARGKVHKWYRDKLVGDSPGLCRGPFVGIPSWVEPDSCMQVLGTDKDVTIALPYGRRRLNSVE